MSGPTHIERRLGDYTDAELRSIVATMSGISTDRICAAIGVFMVHNQDGSHSVGIVRDHADEPEVTGNLLAHAAEHLLGTCTRCPRAPETRGHAER